jgi:hypothetical protein
MQVRDSTGRRLDVGTGYLRGLAVAGDRLVVGSCQARERSRSTGKIVDNLPDPSRLVGKCGLLVYRLAGDGLEAALLVRKVDLKGYGREVYDVLPVGRHARGISAWFRDALRRARGRTGASGAVSAGRARAEGPRTECRAAPTPSRASASPAVIGPAAGPLRERAVP